MFYFIILKIDAVKYKWARINITNTKYSQAQKCSWSIFPHTENIDVYFYNLYKKSNDIQITQLPVCLLNPVTIY